MGDFEEKLNQILSNPQAMEQIMSLANSIAGPPGQESAGAEASAAPQQPSPPPPMGGLGDLLSGLDPGAIGKVMELFSVYQQQSDEKAQLLAALKPFLRPERQSRLEQAIRITRLSRVIRTALGMVQGGADV
ncbi:MAG: hypothetical protein ACI3VN_08855 [Candidatus Onthomonas sp.]